LNTTYARNAYLKVFLYLKQYLTSVMNKKETKKQRKSTIYLFSYGVYFSHEPYTMLPYFGDAFFVLVDVKIQFVTEIFTKYLIKWSEYPL